MGAGEGYGKRRGSEEEARGECQGKVRLRRKRKDALFVVHFLGKVNRAVLVTQTDWAPEQDAHRLVGYPRRKCLGPVRRLGTSLLTTKEEPESPSSNLTLDEVKPFIRGLLVHAQCHSDVGSLSESGVLCSIVTLTEVVNAVTSGKITPIRFGMQFAVGIGYSQVSDHDVHRGRRVIRYDGDVPASFVTGLSKLANGVPFHRQVCPGQLDKSASDKAHRESKE